MKHKYAYVSFLAFSSVFSWVHQTKEVEPSLQLDMYTLSTAPAAAAATRITVLLLLLPLKAPARGTHKAGWLHRAVSFHTKDIPCVIVLPLLPLQRTHAPTTA